MQRPYYKGVTNASAKLHHVAGFFLAQDRGFPSDFRQWSRENHSSDIAGLSALRTEHGIAL
jgi:hypothetical protein